MSEIILFYNNKGSEMAKLPKNFPEYSIMYKTLDKKIKELEERKAQIEQNSELSEIQNKINQYKKEQNKIKSIFPENFFE